MNPAQLHTLIDCESLRDFWQYYRHQYFGLINPGGTIDVGYLADMSGDGRVIYIGKFDGKTAIKPIALSWDNLKEQGLFGIPALGTIKFGPSYLYLSAHARRESIKGLALSRVDSTCPNYQFVFGVYGKNKPQYQKGLGGGHYSDVEELKTAYQIYNKHYFDWDVAVDQLMNGERLGCPISKHCGLFLDQDNPDIQLTYKQKKVAKVLSRRDVETEIILHDSFKNLGPILSYLLPHHVPIR